MGFDFPASPSEGAVYAPAGGPQYTFTNGAWRMIGTPTPLVATALDKNLVVNGAIQISQELGFGVNTAGNNVHSADQWATGQAGATAATHNSSSTESAEGNWIRFGAGGTADAVLDATDYSMLWQKFEGQRIRELMWGTPNALPAVLRFEACTSTIASLVASVALRNAPSGNPSFVKNFTIGSSQWETFVIPIPACTIGTWLTDTSASLFLSFVGRAGSSYQAPTEGVWNAGNYLGTASNGNMCATANATVNIRRIGLHPDPDGTGLAPPWKDPDYASEYLACLRYYQKFGSLKMFVDSSTASTPRRGVTSARPVPMRVSPPIETGTVSGATGTLTFAGSETTIYIVSVDINPAANAPALAGYIANARM